VSGSTITIAAGSTVTAASIEPDSGGTVHVELKDGATLASANVMTGVEITANADDDITLRNVSATAINLPGGSLTVEGTLTAASITASSIEGKGSNATLTGASVNFNTNVTLTSITLGSISFDDVTLTLGKDVSITGSTITVGALGTLILDGTSINNSGSSINLVSGAGLVVDSGATFTSTHVGITATAVKANTTDVAVTVTTNEFNFAVVTASPVNVTGSITTGSIDLGIYKISIAVSGSSVVNGLSGSGLLVTVSGLNLTIGAISSSDNINVDITVTIAFNDNFISVSGEDQSKATLMEFTFKLDGSGELPGSDGDDFGLILKQE
jgi:hypothetical protein